MQQAELVTRVAVSRMLALAIDEIEGCGEAAPEHRSLAGATLEAQMVPRAPQAANDAQGRAARTMLLRMRPAGRRW
jgi:hypothetical protein